MTPHGITGSRMCISRIIFGGGTAKRQATVPSTYTSIAAASTSALNNDAKDSHFEDEWSKAKPFEDIPGLKSFPIVGTGWVLFPIIGYGLDFSQALEFHRRGHKAFGNIWRDKLPGFPPIVSTTRPEDAEKLFRTEGKFPVRPGFETLKLYRHKRAEYYSTVGILAGNGDDWWSVRSKAQQPFLKTRNITSYVPVLGDIADEFIDRIRLIRLENNEMKPDFINELYRWALESVALVGLNTRLGCLSPNLTAESEAQIMIAAANVTFSVMNEIEFGLPVWKYFQTPKLKKLFDAQDAFTKIAVKYINETMEAIKRRPTDSDEETSILEQMLIRGMTPKDATVMAVDMLMAGIDTTSHTTSFLLYFLAKFPEKQNKLRDEILSCVGPKGSPLTADALNELHYLKACIKESLRLRPAAVGNSRITDRDLVLSGYRVPKGSLVAVLQQLMGEMEEFFPNAQEYIPERWIKGHPQESHHHPYTVLPFGFGTRMCIGRRLAELEMWQLTVKILQNFRVEYHYQDIGCLTRLVNTPDQPLRFQFIDLD